MCLVCIEWNKGSLTNREAFKAIQEMVVTRQEDDEEKLDHWFAVQSEIADAIVDERIREMEENDKSSIS